MNSNKCEYITVKGYDVYCKKYKIVLGDIMGYDGKLCEHCPSRFNIKLKTGGGVHIDH